MPDDVGEFGHGLLICFVILMAAGIGHELWQALWAALRSAGLA